MDLTWKDTYRRKSSLEMIISWWWVALFVLSAYLIYSQAMKSKMESLTQLHERVMQLRGAKEAALVENEELEMKIYSQSDPLWIELTLRKGLGLAGEGQVKVHFAPEKRLNQDHAVSRAL